MDTLRGTSGSRPGPPMLPVTSDASPRPVFDLATLTYDDPVLTYDS